MPARFASGVVVEATMFPVVGAPDEKVTGIVVLSKTPPTVAETVFASAVVD